MYYDNSEVVTGLFVPVAPGILVPESIEQIEMTTTAADNLFCSCSYVCGCTYVHTILQ